VWRSQGVVPQRGIPASVSGGVVFASYAPPELLLVDDPLLLAPLLLVLPPLLLVLPPLDEPLDDEDELAVPPELELLNPPLLLPLLLLQPVDAVPEKAPRPRKDEAARQARMV